MNRIDAAFKKLRRERKKALIFFATAGDPTLKVTSQFLRYADKAGVDLIELGVPFSDPLADGPIIQASSARAINKGTTLKKVLALVKKERRRGLRLPVLLMTGVNIVYQLGFERFAKSALSSGVDGIIIPDLPLEESGKLFPRNVRKGIDDILMISPTTDRHRERRILKKAEGFIYYISITGVTGLKKRSRYAFKNEVIRLRSKHRAPVCVGFGISEPRQARAIARFSDGVIVGSALVKELHTRSQRGFSQHSKRFVDSFVKSVGSVR